MAIASESQCFFMVLFSISFCFPAEVGCSSRGSGRGRRTRRESGHPPDSDPLAVFEFAKITWASQDNSLQTRIADWSSTKRVSFSHARATKRFPSPHCASATRKIVRPRESAAQISPIPPGSGQTLMPAMRCPSRYSRVHARSQLRARHSILCRGLFPESAVAEGSSGSAGTDVTLVG